MKPNLQIPTDIAYVTETLQKAGFEAYFVGGCVRDLLMGNNPKDWDVTTNANPEQIQASFPHTFYENSFGTVGVVIHETGDRNKDIVEVTPYRKEGKYSDNRHPDSVSFSEKIEDDLERRDFTMNAIAYDSQGQNLVDLYNGQGDIKDKIIKAVGNPANRISEDALRILRAIRLSLTLDFSLDSELEKAIAENAALLANISVERIRDEFDKMIMSPNPMKGIVMMHGLGVLKYVAPELEEGLGIEQNGDHIYHVWEHNLRALDHSAQNGWPLHVRLAALFHDVGKPATRVWSAEKNDWTFYGHDVVGGKMTAKLMSRLHYPREMIEVVAKLVRYHLFFSDIEKITLSAVRRIVRNVGPEHVWDLMKVRACDRIGMGRPKEKPYRLRKYEAMIEEAMRAPVSVAMLKINGGKVIEITKLPPSPKIGFILHALLEDVLDDPTKNTEEHLETRAIELSKLSDDELKATGEAGKAKKEEEEAKEIETIRKRHWVK
jgi:tRNA nucleotidyltransferase (CCA-adding enzyme)